MYSTLQCAGDRRPCTAVSMCGWVARCSLARMTERFKWWPEMFNDLVHVCLASKLLEADHFLLTTVSFSRSVCYTMRWNYIAVTAPVHCYYERVGLVGRRWVMEWLAGRSRWPRALVTQEVQRTKQLLHIAVEMMVQREMTVLTLRLSSTKRY